MHPYKTPKRYWKIYSISYRKLFGHLIWNCSSLLYLYLFVDKLQVTYHTTGNTTTKITIHGSISSYMGWNWKPQILRECLCYIYHHVCSELFLSLNNCNCLHMHCFVRGIIISTKNSVLLTWISSLLSDAYNWYMAHLEGKK